MSVKGTATALREQQIFICNGIQYLGTLKKEGETLKASDALQFTSNDEKQIFREWVAARHTDDLENFEIDGGNNQITRKNLTDKQLMIADSVAASADYAVKYALKDVEKNAILDS
jgi:hypothetical protein